MNIAGITALYYAADMAHTGAAIGDLHEAARFPIDVDQLTFECGHPVAAHRMLSEQHLDAAVTEILQDWAPFGWHARLIMRLLYLNPDASTAMIDSMR